MIPSFFDCLDDVIYHSRNGSSAVRKLRGVMRGQEIDYSASFAYVRDIYESEGLAGNLRVSDIASDVYDYLIRCSRNGGWV